MRITDQYIWNVIFLTFFLVLVFMGTVILDGEATERISTLTFFDFFIMMLATARLTRLMVYDKITAFFREQFLDPVESRGGYVLEKPLGGLRRTMSDLLSCPWCVSVWASATVAFFYVLTPYAFYPVLFLALSAMATLLQLLANMIGWKAEQLKNDVEGR
jgi:hypothetical protein